MSDDSSKLNENFLKLQQEADDAEKAAQAEPKNQELKKTAEDKAALAARAKATIDAAEQPHIPSTGINTYIASIKTPENKPSTGGIIALGFYLLLMMFLTLYLLGGLMTAETDPVEVDKAVNNL